MVLLLVWVSVRLEHVVSQHGWQQLPEIKKMATMAQPLKIKTYYKNWPYLNEGQSWIWAIWIVVIIRNANHKSEIIHFFVFIIFSLCTTKTSIFVTFCKKRKVRWSFYYLYDIKTTHINWWHERIRSPVEYQQLKWTGKLWENIGCRETFIVPQKVK